MLVTLEVLLKHSKRKDVQRKCSFSKQGTKKYFWIELSNASENLRGIQKCQSQFLGCFLLHLENLKALGNFQNYMFCCYLGRHQ